MISLRSRTVGDRFDREAVLGLLREAARLGADELHFKVPGQPVFRIGGDLVPAMNASISPSDSVDIAMHLAALAEVEVSLANGADFAFGLREVGRMRVAVYRQRGSVAIAVTRVQTAPPRPAELGIPVELLGSLGKPGLTLVVGAGRASGLHALVAMYNQTSCGLVVLAEERLTMLHRDDRALIAQREVGTDVKSYVEAIRHAARTGADLVVLAEIPDCATADAAIGAAEDGASVIIAVRGPDRPTAERTLIHLFDPAQRPDVAARLARVVTMVLPCNAS
jgi:twitching motility protein PilT